LAPDASMILQRCSGARQPRLGVLRGGIHPPETAMPPVETRTVEPDEAGIRLDRWFRVHFPEVGFAHLQKLIRSGQVRVDGGRAKTSTRLSPGQAVRVPPVSVAGGQGEAVFPGKAGSGGAQAASVGQAPTRKALRPDEDAQPPGDADFLRSILLHEDEDVFVFNKPAGLAVQGGSGLTRHVDALLEALRDRKAQKPRLVHRLDRDTSGVLVVARTRLAAQKLAAAFRSRSTRKIYWALVKGVLKPKQGRVSTWLAKEGGAEGERMRVARHGADEASHAV